ncbi:MAG: potassium channel family protein [Rhodothermaceae bacterium]
MHTKRIKLYVTFSLLVLVVVIGIIGFMILENKSFTDSFYYVIVTLSTVGYGDVHPTTTGGKYLAMFMIIGGVGTFMSIFANLADLFISRHEEEKRKEKLSTIISLFFTEVGNEFINLLVSRDSNVHLVRDLLTKPENFIPKNSKRLKKEIAQYKVVLKSDQQLFQNIKNVLVEKTNFLVSLLENSNALEYDLLTKLLWSLLHVRDEFLNRRDTENLSDDDIEHLTEDLERVYELLRILWIDNMINTKSKYPNFFGLSMFMNPFVKK